jgi:hypothetical protein
VLPETFTKPRREFCDYFSNLRNQELHTSELPFESLSETKWLARCYDVCKVLCEHLGKALADLFGEEANSAGNRSSRTDSRGAAAGGLSS